MQSFSWAPRVRAENGNPGDFEYYDGEVNDVIAAGRYVVSLKGVDKTRVFVGGHSAGADLANWGEPLQKQSVALAQQSKHDASLTVVPGDHGQSLPNAIPGIVRMLQSCTSSPAESVE